MHSYIPCHNIFDVNMDFTRRYHYVDTGCHVPKYDEKRYSGVLSRDIVHIDFTYTDFNQIGIMAVDIQNVHLITPLYEQYCTRRGPEFESEHDGKKSIIVWPLYGLTCEGMNFRELICNCIKHLGFESCPDNSGVQLHSDINSGGKPQYEYMMMYTDDCLCVSENGEIFLMIMETFSPLNPGSTTPLNIYLG